MPRQLVIRPENVILPGSRFVAMRSGFVAGGAPVDDKRISAMPRVCKFTGKRTRVGNQIARRGKAKYLGGVGKKTTGVTRRRFKPNIQTVRAIIDGKVCRIRVSTRAIRDGLVVKPVKRQWKPQDATA